MSWKTETYQGWGRALSATGELARPERHAHLLALPAAPALGNRRSYGDTCLNNEGRAIEMNRLDRVISFDAKTGVLEAEAGLQIGEVCAIFAPLGWMPAVMPGTGFATVGGCIAMDVHGKNHHTTGSFGQHVLSVKLLSGGKITAISPSRSKALFTATMSGMGQTGVIVSAKLQLVRAVGTAMRVTENRVADWEEHITLLSASDAPYCVGWIDATAKGDALGRGIVEEAEVSDEAAPAKEGRAKSVPMNAPRWALSGPIVRAFNGAYYRKIPENGRSSIKPMADFFFPLDKVHNWNKLYGKAGFHQFQCVVPLGAEDALRDMLESIAKSGLASPLAVLKRLGKGRAGAMSFPIEGYTLAVDFPNRKGAAALITSLNARALELGGRVYLAKDALAGEAEVKAMYPEHGKWAAEVNKADPKHELETDQIRRLNLRGKSS